MVLGAALTACTGGATSEQPVPVPAESIACPQDVELQVVPQHECFEIAVPAPSGGPEVRVFVVSVEPPEPSAEPPVVVPGVDTGTTPDYGGIAPAAQRTGRRVLIVDLPGVGHSTPSLACPEVAELGATAGVDDPAAVAGGVAACRERLESQGVVPSDFTLEFTGQVLHAVVAGLGIPEAVAAGHGRTGVAALHWAAEHPGEVVAAYFDSPTLDLTDVDGTVERHIASLAASCRSTESCREAYGDPAQDW